MDTSESNFMTAAATNNNAGYGPDWLVRAISSSAEDELSHAEQGLKIQPELSGAHFQALLGILPLLQQKLIGSSSGRVSISRQFLDSVVCEADRQRSRELLKTLGGLRVGFRVGSAQCYFEKLILRESLTFEYGDSVHHFQFSEIGKAMMLGFFEPYYFLNANSFASFEVSRFFTSNREPIIIDQLVWQKLNEWERSVYLNLLSCKKRENDLVDQCSTNFAPFESIFLGNTAYRTGKGQPSIAEIRQLGQKFVSLGVMSGFQESDSYPLRTNNTKTLSLCWKPSLAKTGASKPSEIATLLAKGITERLAVGKIPDVFLGLIETSQKNNVLDFARNVAKNGQPASLDSGRASNLSRNSMLLINPVLLYLDWSLRIQRSDVYMLPLVLSANSLFQSIGLRPLVSIEIFERFFEIAVNHPDEFEELLKIRRSTLATTSDWDYELLVELAMRNLETKKVSGTEQRGDEGLSDNLVESQCPPLPTPVDGLDVDFAKTSLDETDRTVAEKNEKMIQAPIVTDLIADVSNVAPLIEHVIPKALLRSTAEKELSNMEQYDPGQYRKLKERYLESLDPVRLRLIDDLSSRMGSSVFKSHLRHGLLKYMIENPNCWSSTHSEKMYPWL